MSTADLPSRRAPRGDRGFTAIEMAIALSLVALMTVVIGRTSTSIMDTDRLLRSIRNTSTRGQHASYELRDLVSASRKLFNDDAVGQAYLAKLDRHRYPGLTGSRLPLFDEANPLGPDDAGDPHTGNVLLFVREGDPAPCVANAATKKIRTVDCYRFVCLYLTATSRSLVAGQAQALDLVVWRSEVYPSYGQVMAIADTTERKNVAKDLFNRFGCDLLWDSTAPVATAFYGVDTFGTIAATPYSVASIPEDMNVSSGGRFVSANLGVARTDATSFARSSVFTLDPVTTWKPDGFEVKVAGASGSRKVWMRLTIEQQAAAGRVPAQQSTVVANTRDL